MNMDIGNHPGIVITTYVFALIPWTIVQSIDFIGRRWKTVKQTREHGYFQLLVSFIPLFFVIPYMVVQFIARDFKEMSTAIVAIFFAFLHIFRTAWGLLQVHEFREWASEAILILESHDIAYELDLQEDDEEELKILQKKHNPDSPEVSKWKADRVEINETIVDNQIFSGDTPCDLICSWRGRDYNVFKDIREGGSSIYERVLRVFYELKEIFSKFPIFCGLKKTFGCSTRILKQEPRDPTEVWIRWAASFAAQGLGSWIEKVYVSPDESEQDKTCDYIKRYNLHAREVLSAACLLQIDPKEMGQNSGFQFGEGHPLQWDRLSRDQRAREETSFRKQGKVSRKDLLLRALSSGSRLPFNTHLIPVKQTKKPNRDVKDIERSGFEPYQHNIERVAESVPAKFGKSVNRFNFKQLECLTIFLNLGLLKSPKEVCAANGKNKSNETPKMNEETADHKTATVGNFEPNHEILTDYLAPVKNLKHQLGISSISSEIVKIPDSSSRNSEEGDPQGSSVFCSPLPLPISQKGQGRIFETNKTVLEVSGLIDINISLQAGSFMKRIEESEGERKKLLLDTIRVFNCDSNGQEKNSKIRRNGQIILEQVRLAAQFNTCDTSSIHGEQTVSFLGVAMEEIRSALQRYKENNQSPGEEGGQSKDATEEDYPTFSGSNSFVAAFKEFGSSKETLQEFLRNRTTQIRIIWELQKECFRKLRGQASLDNRVAKMGCLLSFPSLYCEIADLKRGCTVESRESDTKVELEAWECTVCIIPAAGPQQFFVCADIDTEGNIKAKIKGVENLKVKDFDWSAWRDAFNDRLQGSRAWRWENGLYPLQVCTTEEGIDAKITQHDLAGKTGVKCKLWKGWLPHIPQICDFEPGEDRGDQGKKENPDFESELIKKAVQRTQLVEFFEKEGGNQESEANLPGGFWNSVLNQGRAVERGVTKVLWNWFPGETHAGGNSFESLKVMMELLCNEKSDLRDLHQALSLICLEIEKQPKAKEKLEKIREWLQHIVCYSNYDPKAVCALSQFERKQENSGKMTSMNDKNCTTDVIRFLRVSYMMHGDNGTLQEVLESCADFGYLRDDATGKPKNYARNLVIWTSWFGFANELLKKKGFCGGNEDVPKEAVPKFTESMVQDCPNDLKEAIKIVYEYQKETCKEMTFICEWLKDDPVGVLNDWWEKQRQKAPGNEGEKGERPSTGQYSSSVSTESVSNSVSAKVSDLEEGVERPEERRTESREQGGHSTGPDGGSAAELSKILGTESKGESSRGGAEGETEGIEK